MSSNFLQDYKDNYRANLPAGVTYDPVTADYFYNNKRFQTIQQVEWYRRYLFATEGFTSVVADAYAVAGFGPPLVADFKNEYYRIGGAVSTFDGVFTHDRSGNATMVDSDGLRKWAPHNLLTYSEQFDNANWNKFSGWFVDGTTGYAAPNGTNTADAIIPSAGTSLPFTRQTANVTGSKHTFCFYIKAGNAGVQWIRCVDASESNSTVWFDIINGVVGTTQSNVTGATITAASNSFWKIEFSVFNFDANVEFAIAWASADGNSAATRTWSGVEIAFYIWGAHLYRSDLGGMVDNPDTGDSYVPTTSSARYLPRRGNHIYNGSEWVNAGYLNESEARTNLLTYSNDFTDASWSKFNITVAADALVTNPDSTLGATLVSTTGGTGTLLQDISYSDVRTSSFWLKAGDVTLVQFRPATATQSPNNPVFDLSNGTVNAYTTAGVLDASIIPFPNGWFRCSVTVDGSAIGATRIGWTPMDDASTVTSVAKDCFYIYGAQLEVASTPSSYIPTLSGSTVTRAADTIQVDAGAAPWPTPNVIGPELVTNGTFDTDVSGWLPVADTGQIVTWQSGGYARFDRNSGNSSFSSAASVPEAGKVYLVSVDVLDNTFGGALTLSIGGASFLVGTNVSAGTYSRAIVTTSTAPLGVVLGFASVGYYDLDNISVREIDPLSVSIQMDGTMDYADEDNVANVVFGSWLEDASNFIEKRLATNGTRLGGAYFLQADGGTIDTVIEAAPGSYSPGINVPFNIASRHGSTFINGAVDGTALTANTTPTALPDLSATALEIGYNHMGNIGMVRVWADDLGDSGIATATAPSLEPSLFLDFIASGETSYTVSDWSA